MQLLLCKRIQESLDLKPAFGKEQEPVHDILHDYKIVSGKHNTAGDLLASILCSLLHTAFTADKPSTAPFYTQ